MLFYDRRPKETPAMADLGDLSIRQIEHIRQKALMPIALRLRRDPLHERRPTVQTLTSARCASPAIMDQHDGAVTFDGPLNPDI